MITGQSKKSLVVLGLFLLCHTINAQQIFQKGKLQFRTGETVGCLILEDSYTNYAHGVTYKTTDNSKLSQAGYKELIGFQIGDYQKFMAFRIREKIPMKERYQYQSIFLKQLEKGELNLFEYDNGHNVKWLYIQKDNLPLQKLYVIRKDYASEFDNTTPIKIDSLATTQSPAPGIFGFEKKFKLILRNATEEESRPKIPNDLTVKTIRNFVSRYNNQQSGKLETRSYFKQRAGIRLFVTGSFYSINQKRTHLASTIGEEIEFLFNSEKKRTSLTIGFAHRAKVKEEKIDLPDSPTNPITTIKVSQFYLRANSYLNIQNQLKPYFYGGFKFTYPVAGRDTYDRLNSVMFNSNSIFNLIGFGLGVLYEFKNRPLIKLEIGNRFFPDIKLGVGWKLQ